ncbi:BCCT family transporter [Corynebacterium bovis]|uniref:Glycine/betaine ABC transporter n=6 Tax=Corynebacterium bovis TaxID=36808 RepID=A0A3R8QLF7_9CORY|nr:BCCT family transporter [Corynebacterium bovis]RRO90911.1 glycine/betaine ABC transporter [Corynebacterium bovis]RRO99897.1 glycine/betaine ABC transporter [Corynebacterium bovis]RRQ02548.1 glycine/betaine ABC transporter [Corynebacterium bovis]RRQ05353.1 glycine/betaine ABC transporter [Corynebacterium bovis]RRQ06623.1 glycine/betaine ABC transporter [Corynebacterium bovis]
MPPPPADDADAPVDWIITGVVAVVTLAIVVWGLLAPDNFASFATNALDFVVTDFGWLFVVAGTVFVFFALAVAFSRFGRIKLGQNNEQPEFHTLSWIAMMFAAGMGIGLMFYGVAEPLNFFRGGVPGHGDHEVESAFASTLFHWTLHPWSIYAIVGLSIAYGTFRLGRKQLLSSAFIPLIGVKGAEGPVGKIVDILAIIATVFGTAASLGLGALQIGSGLDSTGIVHNPGTPVLLGVIVVLGVAYLASAASGVGKGIQWLSNFNMVLAGLLALFVLVVGPTVVSLNTIPTAVGSYFDQFFEMAGRTADSDGTPTKTAAEWLSGNTIFYWAWWISWSPFVGMFVAWISRGRTIREFILVVLLVPSAVTVVWFSVFGGSAVEAEKAGHSVFGDGNAEKQLFSLLDSFPAGTVTSVIAMILLATFFITSADSASTVMGTMSQNGRLIADRRVTVLWGALTGLIAAVLLISGKDEALTNLQNVTIIAASPFVVIIIALMVSLVKGLSNDPMYLDEKEQRRFGLRLARERRLQAEDDAREQRRRQRDERRRHAAGGPGDVDMVVSPLPAGASGGEAGHPAVEEAVEAAAASAEAAATSAEEARTSAEQAQQWAERPARRGFLRRR